LHVLIFNGANIQLFNRPASRATKKTFFF